MEIKATLQKPYTENERMNFIVEYNHNQTYEIEETETELQALGYTEEEIALQEKERIALLSLTRGDVFRGLLMARGVTRLMLRGMIETNEQLTEVQKEMALIDFDEALNFYRGNALIDTVGLALGIEPEQLDKFFEYNDYTYLLVKTDEELPTDEIVEQEDNTEVEDDSISTDISE